MKKSLLFFLMGIVGEEPFLDDVIGDFWWKVIDDIIQGFLWVNSAQVWSRLFIGIAELVRNRNRYKKA